MCTRADQDGVEKIRDFFGVPDAHYMKVAGDDAAVVRFNPQTRKRSIDILRWGLVPSWAQDPSIGPSLKNARGESVRYKPSFEKAFQKRRCIVPMSGFYERNCYFVHKDRSPLSVAGLWEGWRNPATGHWLKTFTVITTAPNRTVGRVHDRMPVILKPEDWAKWLGEEPAGVEELVQMLKPYPDELIDGVVAGSIAGVRAGGADDLFS